MRMTPEEAPEAGRVVELIQLGKTGAALYVIEQMLDERTRVATRKATRTAELMRHAALRQLGADEAYQELHRQAECLMTGQDA